MARIKSSRGSVRSLTAFNCRRILSFTLYSTFHCWNFIMVPLRSTMTHCPLTPWTTTQLWSLFRSLTGSGIRIAPLPLAWSWFSGTGSPPKTPPGRTGTRFELHTTSRMRLVSQGRVLIATRPRAGPRELTEYQHVTVTLHEGYCW